MPFIAKSPSAQIELVSAFPEMENRFPRMSEEMDLKKVKISLKLG